MPTWIIVLIGLLFNILAASIAHFVIEGKTTQLSSLSMQMDNNSKEIDLFWAQIEGIERKREMLYLLLNQTSNNTQVQDALVTLLTSYLQVRVDNKMLNDLSTMDQLINQYQQDIREKIDNKFFLNIELAELDVNLQQEISWLRNWSIFLQMIGLSLILARDLTRKR